MSSERLAELQLKNGVDFEGLAGILEEDELVNIQAGPFVLDMVDAQKAFGEEEEIDIDVYGPKGKEVYIVYRWGLGIVLTSEDNIGVLQTGVKTRKMDYYAGDDDYPDEFCSQSAKLVEFVNKVIENPQAKVRRYATLADANMVERAG